MKNLLKTIREEALAGELSSGICDSVINELIGLPRGPHDIDKMAKLISKWPLHSGDSLYPVPSSQHSQPGAAFQMAYLDRILWDQTTEYGRARLALLDYLIENWN